MKDTVLSTNIISILKIKRLRHRELKQLAQGHEASGLRVYALHPYHHAPWKTSSDTTVNDVIKSVSFGIMMGIIGIFFLRRENMILSM